MKLPIERIQDISGPAQYRWRQTTPTMIGPRTIEHKGLLPPTMVEAIEELIALVKMQDQEIVGLRRTIDRLEKELTKKVEVANIPRPEPKPTKEVKTKGKDGG